MITAFTSDEEFDYQGLYRDFIERETDATGTVVLHHGMVKRPGKQIPDFSNVSLRALADDPDAKLIELAETSRNKFNLNQVLIVHRLGNVNAGDSVLLAIVSSDTRDRSFAACSWIVDEIKWEEFIELKENR